MSIKNPPNIASIKKVASATMIVTTRMKMTAPLIRSSRSCFPNAARRWLSSSCKIVEVGPRDGLQNEKSMVSTLDKVSLIQRLVSAGCTTVEVGAFVSPKWVPQMANTAQVLESLETPDSGINFSCLVPNMEGMKRAQQYETCTEVAIFASASESFSRKNINCSIMESMERFRPILEQSTKPIRGYVSCVVACPYEGKVDAAKVVQVSEQLLEMGCYEISLGDTIGVGTPRDVRNLLDAMKASGVPSEKLAVHFHDTYGQSLANILVALDYHVATVDSSVAGLGGCPYAAGASGNVATEEVCYMLNGMGVETGIDLDKLVDAGVFICSVLGKVSNSRVAQAVVAKRR